MARVPSSRHTLHCGIRLPDRGTKPFPPSARAGQVQLAQPDVPPDWKPRGADATS
jgi:hypothetical protein